MMLCPFCNGFRPVNNASCPLCNAPSPIGNDAWNGQNASFPGNQNQASWGGSGVAQNDWGNSSPDQMAFPPSQANFGGSGVWNDPSANQMAFPSSQTNFGGSGIQQMSFPQPGQQAFAQPQDGGSDNSFWSQNRATRGAQGASQQSMLPVPYQDANGQALSLLPTSFPTIAPGIQQVNPLVPALPHSEQEAPVYVAPMYTKPRPIIPRYRAISGLLSVIIVFSLLCTGAGYYAQVTGRLTSFEKFFGTYSPPSIVTAQQHILQVPSNQVVYSANPAAKVVDSVGISTSENHGLIPSLINQFTVGQTIWLVCGANISKQAGIITIKWYTNGHFYKLDASDTIKSNQSVSAVFHIIYGLPTEGKAEVYWNDELAATVLFVVQPAAA